LHSLVTWFELVWLWCQFVVMSTEYHVHWVHALYVSTAGDMIWAGYVTALLVTYTAGTPKHSQAGKCSSSKLCKVVCCHCRNAQVSWLGPICSTAQNELQGWVPEAVLCVEQLQGGCQAASWLLPQHHRSWCGDTAPTEPEPIWEFTLDNTPSASHVQYV